VCVRVRVCEEEWCGGICVVRVAVRARLLGAAAR